MRVIVQKFGGAVLATPAGRQAAANKIIKAIEDGYSPLVVVSAMGRYGAPYATDTLIGMVKDLNPHVAARDLDIIMQCGEMISATVMSALLQAAQYPTKVFTGQQAGIITNNNFGAANILRVDTSRLRPCLLSGQIPIVCGFQGANNVPELTTLGRGGSDTTATALGAVFKAELIEIYSATDGFMSADPRIVSNAVLLENITYSEALQLAQLGTKIIHPRAVEIAMQKNIPIVIKSVSGEKSGTMISNKPLDTEETAICDAIATGITYSSALTQFSLRTEPAHTHAQGLQIFKALADAQVNVDFINIHPGHVMFTVAQEQTDAALQILKTLDCAPTVLRDCAKVTVIGGGMGEVPGVMATFVESLAEKNINILQTVDSQSSISVLVNRDDVAKAVQALHDSFKMGS